MACRSLSSSKAAAQNCRCRISLSRGSTSYSTSSRSMVFRWACTMASATRCAMAASSPSPASMACSVWLRHASAPAVLCNSWKCARRGPSSNNRSARRDRPAAPHIGRSLVFQEMEAHHHVGHLHAGVVDVVLHLDLRRGSAQHADEGVAQRGVAQVADMRGLVGIDVGVLDDNLSAGGVAVGHDRPQLIRIGSAVEPDIDVAVAGHLQRCHPRNRPDLGGQLGGDFLRRLAQLFGKLEGCRHRDFAEITLPGLLDHHAQIHAVADRMCARNAAATCFSMDWNTGTYEYNSRPKSGCSGKACWRRRSPVRSGICAEFQILGTHLRHNSKAKCCEFDTVINRIVVYNQSYRIRILACYMGSPMRLRQLLAV
jgi:hypothetical protein